MEVALKQFPIYLTSGRRGMLTVPNIMYPEDYALLKTQIQNFMQVIEETSVIQPSLTVAADSGKASQ